MKRLILLIILLFLSITVFPQEYRNIVINGGVSDNNDFSVLVGGKFPNNRLYSSVEYSHNTQTTKNGGLIGIGLMSKISILSLKGGICYYQLEDNALNNSMKSEFDYGVEYLWLADDKSKTTLCYGLSFTHCNGIELKLGVAF